MKNTNAIKQFLTKVIMPPAKSFKDLLGSIKDGKFTKEGGKLLNYEMIPFSCRALKLTSLIGSPKFINGDFICSYNNLVSLDGSPQIVSGKFGCENNKLVSLQGSAHQVNGSFRCSNNELVTLQDGPSIVGGDFYCSNNKLESLLGAPSKVNLFNCWNNKLTTLEGSPITVTDSFYCNSNNLTSLIGSPTTVGNDFYCRTNNLESLKSIHLYIQEINGVADFMNNPIKERVLGLLKIKGLKTVLLDNKQVEQIVNRYLPEGDVLNCINELKAAGFTEYALW